MHIDPFTTYTRSAALDIARQLQAGYVDAGGNWFQLPSEGDIKVERADIEESEHHYTIRTLLVNEHEGAIMLLPKAKEHP